MRCVLRFVLALAFVASPLSVGAQEGEEGMTPKPSAEEPALSDHSPGDEGGLSPRLRKRTQRNWDPSTYDARGDPRPTIIHLRATKETCSSSTRSRYRAWRFHRLFRRRPYDGRSRCVSAVLHQPRRALRDARFVFCADRYGCGSDGRWPRRHHRLGHCSKPERTDPGQGTKPAQRTPSSMGPRTFGTRVLSDADAFSVQP